MSLKSSFVHLSEANTEHHPLLFLGKDDRAWAFAKAHRGYFYLTHKGLTWKVYHVNRRNSISKYQIVWRKYLPKYKPPLSEDQIIKIEEWLIDANIKTYRYKSRSPRDKQVNKVYGWEKKLSIITPDVFTTLSPSEARDLANEVVIDLGLRPIKVVHKNPRKNGRYDALAYGGYKIEMFKTSRIDLLHELAHTVFCQLSKSFTEQQSYKFQAHGSEFIAFYSFLLHRYGKLPKATITDTLSWDEIERDECLLKLLYETYPVGAGILIDNDDSGDCG